MKLFRGKKFFKILSLILTIGILFTIAGCADNTDDIDDVDDSVHVTGVAILTEDDDITITTKEGTLQFDASVTPSNATDQSVTWSVAYGTGSANIDQNGLLTAVSDGTVTVKVKSVDNTEITAEIIVTMSNQAVVEVIDVTAITMQSEDDAIIIDTFEGTLQLSASMMPLDATNQAVIWSVVDGSGSATIDQMGLLTAVSDGTVTATVTSEDMPTLSASLVVTMSNQVVTNSAPLSAAIFDANENLNETMVGLSADEFVPEVKWVLAADYDLYAAAIEDAEVILSETSLTDQEVSDAVLDLETATTTFNEAKQDGTKTVMGINLGTADDFVILSKTGIATTGTTAIVGNIGVSPVSASYITGFGLIMDGSGEFATSSLITGMVYAADYTTPTPSYLTTVIADMNIAYDDGLSRVADYTELYTGDLSGKTLETGVYMWSGNVLINTDLTLNGSATDVMIFQVAGSLTMAANTQITLTGGLLPENIYWVVADTVSIGSDSAFQGVLLAKTNVSMGTNSSIVGMIYAQTSVALDATSVTKA